MRLTLACMFLAGIPTGWAWTFYSLRDSEAVIYCLATSSLLLIAAWGARPRPLPEQRLERALYGLRVVGREERR